MRLSVKQLADLANISTRTLHYYDEIGLLKPSGYERNGYRYYEKDSLFRLQQILFYRELDISLREIKAFLDDPEFDPMVTLSSHRKALQGQVQRLSRLIAAIDRTILHLKGKQTMSDKKLFEAFSEEQVEKYAEEAEKRYDPQTVKESYKKWKSYTPEEKQRILDEGNRIYTDMVAAMPEGPASLEVQAIVERWRAHMDYFWTPDLEQLLGLASMYNNSPDFKSNFDAIHPSLAAFMLEAVEEYVKNNR